jgi:hypothetical protein
VAVHLASLEDESLFMFSLPLRERWASSRHARCGLGGLDQVTCAVYPRLAIQAAERIFRTEITAFEQAALAIWTAATGQILDADAIVEPTTK